MAVLVHNYTGAMDFLHHRLPSFFKGGAVKSDLKLDNIKALCEWQGNPQLAFKAIHVAGTNGKGSVCHMMASILQEMGFKVGLHTSPHLIDFRERTGVNGTWIDEQFLVDMVNLLIQEKMVEKINPSFFDVSIWIAFMFFRHKRVDYAVIETGLGGRLDTTNILMPILSVITQIGYDHQDILGHTLAEIAAEKAGIIKQQTPVVVGEYHSDYAHVMEQKAIAMQAPLRWASQEVRVEQVQYNVHESTYELSYIRDNKPPIEIKCPLTGKYQQNNIATVVVAVHSLQQSIGLPCTEEHIKQGIQRVKQHTRLRGRWDCVYVDPMVIIDGAHNAHGLAYAIQQAMEISQDEQKPLSIIYGVLKDKDVDACLSLLPKEANYYFCQPALFRALPVQELAERATTFGLQGSTHPTVAQAISSAIQKRDGLILIIGSLFVAGEALIFFDRYPKHT